MPEGGGTTLISTDGKKVGDPGCPLAHCAPIRALSEGPEGELWFAAGEAIGRYRPSPLFLVKIGPVKFHDG